MPMISGSAASITVPLEAGTPVQQPVRWGVYARDYVERAYLQGDSGWRQGQPHSKIELQPGPPPAEAG